jgi:hypothetical protein
MPKLPWIAFSILLVLATAASVRAGSVLGDDFNQEETHDYGGLPKLRLNLEAGYSQWMYNPDSLSPSYEKYLNSLETGWNMAADIVYFPWAKGGIGMMWIWFLSKTENPDLHLDSTDAAGHVVSDRASFVYYGPTFMSRLRLGRNGLLVGSFSAGWMDILYTMSRDGALGEVKAGKLAVVANVGWEYSVYRLVSIGINGRMLLCNLDDYTFNGKKVDINDKSAPEGWRNIGMSRFEIDLGIRFGL